MGMGTGAAAGVFCRFVDMPFLASSNCKTKLSVTRLSGPCAITRKLNCIFSLGGTPEIFRKSLSKATQSGKAVPSCMPIEYFTGSPTSKVLAAKTKPLAPNMGFWSAIGRITRRLSPTTLLYFRPHFFRLCVMAWLRFAMLISSKWLGTTSRPTDA